MKCPICGGEYKSPRKHLLKHHGIRLRNEESANLYLAIYRIFEKKGYMFPLVPLEKLEFDELCYIMEKISEIFKTPGRAKRFFSIFAEELGRRYGERVLEEFPEIARESRGIFSFLAYMAILCTGHPDAIPIAISLCKRRHLALLEYLVGLFQGNINKVEEYIKDLIRQGAMLSTPYVIFHAIFFVDPAKFSSLLSFYISSLGDKLEGQMKELVDIFDSILSISPELYPGTERLEAICMLAKIKFYGTLAVDVKGRQLERMIKFYKMLDVLEDIWIDIYYSCHKKLQKIDEKLLDNTYFVPREIMAKLRNIMQNYPNLKDKLKEISTSDLLRIADDIPSKYLRCYFLFIVADIYTKYGLLDRARSLLEYVEKNMDKSFDYYPRAILLRANIEEFDSNYRDAIKYYNSILEWGSDWHKFLFDYARALIFSKQYRRAEEILKKAPRFIYREVLEAYIKLKIGETYRAKEIMEKTGRYILTDNPEEAFTALWLMEKICNCMYKESWRTIESNYDLQVLLLDILAITCPRHFRPLVEELHAEYPDNTLLKYYMGVLCLEKEDYNTALCYFEESSKNDKIDRTILWLNMLMAAIETRNRALAGNLATKLYPEVDRDDAIAIALVHYHMFMGDFDKAEELLEKNSDKIEYRVYQGLRRQINKRKFNMDLYTYYFTAQRRTLITCPLT